MRAFTALRLFVTAALLSVSAILGAQAQQVVSRVTERIDSSNMATLHSGVHPLARAEFDRGEVSGDTRTDRVQLILARSSTQENALRTLLEQQQDASSLAYHQWLTPTAFGSAYGPSDADIATLTAWLAAQGFSAIHVNHGRTVVEFSGTAAQMKSAFHVSLHHYLVQGVTYTANAAEPQVPAALVPIVAGFGSLNNFPRHADNVPAGTVRRDRTTGAYTKLTSSSLFAAPAAAAEADSGPLPDFTFTENKVTSYGITPYDFATIYDVLPLWNASTPIDGTGQVIAITGRTDLNPVDFINFRNIFGLPTGAAATTTGSSYLNIIYNGPNPGINGDEPEADIDTQWSGAVAKGATIDFVTSADTVTSYGIDLSAQYIVDNNLAPVMSTSYGACELSMGTAYNLEYLQLWEQASAQGITAVVSAGDAGNAGCEQDQSTPSTVGTAISGFQSTPFNISVGGTDFNIAQGATKYFSSTNSTTTQASALSYIPEVPWNDSCTNFQISLFPPWTGLTAEQVCNTSTARSDGLDSIGGGSGGPSSCISSSGYSSASCTGGYAKPSWQAGVGVPADGVRDTPDVALFASNGFWGAFYLVCNQDSSLNGTCDVNAPYEDFAGYGGTSVAAPAFAGMMALVNQKTGVRQGNANYILYKLYNNQVTAATACNSNSSPASGCIFNDVAIGTISQPCYSYALNCAFTTTTDQVGTLKGGAATTGYDTANGLGSVNAANLVNGWSAATTTSTTTKLTLSPTTFVHGTAVTAGVTVASASGTPLGDVSILGSTTNGTATYGTLAGGAYNTTLDVAPAGAQSGLNANTLPGGSYNVTAHYGGSSLYAESDSAPWP
jgi:subtilase family serine protease